MEAVTIMPPLELAALGEVVTVELHQMQMVQADKQILEAAAAVVETILYQQVAVQVDLVSSSSVIQGHNEHLVVMYIHVAVILSIALLHLVIYVSHQILYYLPNIHSQSITL